MTLTLDLPPETERRLTERAGREGLTVTELVEDAVTRDLDADPVVEPPCADHGQVIPLRELFADIDEAEGEVDPEVAQREWEQFRQNVNETRRLEGRPPAYPDDKYGPDADPSAFGQR